MSDADLRARYREDPKDPRARAWALRAGLPLEPEVGDEVEVGFMYPLPWPEDPSDLDPLSRSFCGLSCPVRAVVIGSWPWKLTPGASPIVLLLPPASYYSVIAARDRVRVTGVARFDPSDLLGPLGPGEPWRLQATSRARRRMDPTVTGRTRGTRPPGHQEGNPRVPVDTPPSS